MVDYVRVKLLWNGYFSLRFQRLFQFGDVETVLKFQSENLRNFCNICGMMTHDASECLENVKTEPADEGDQDNDDDEDYLPRFHGDNTRNGGPEPFVNVVDEGHNPTITRK